MLGSKKFLFEEDHVMIVIYNIMCAINWLQSANVMHRDLKPGNILVSDECEVKICDFGMARTIVQEKKRKNS
jgi:serine/threonine protein kinase